jgi:hypothetical protein
MRFCPNCGNPLGGSPRYCAGCATQVGAGNDTASAPSWQAGPETPLSARTPAPAWSFHDPPAPWLPGASGPPVTAAAPGDPPPGDPGWAARHPSREPAQPPWPASGPPWAASPPPWPAGDPPAWAVIPGPAAEDQAAAMITESRGTSLPAAPRAARPGRRLRLYRRLRLSPGHGMTITAMVTTLALLGTLAAAAWQVSHIRSQTPAAGTSLAARASGTGRRAGPPDPDPSPARAASSVTPGAQAASGVVTAAPAVAGQPHVDRVVMLLDHYFSAVNQHDFPAYRSLFIPAIRAGMHNFGSSYQSTHDSRARLTGLAATGPQGLAAMVTFVSHQDPAASPDHAACDRWHITLFIKRDGHGYHIRRHRPGFPADTVRACR